MKERIKVDILGSCVVRDPFEMCRELKENYQVNFFAQNNPPITLGYDKLSETTGLTFVSEDFKNTPPVWFKWFSWNAEEELYTLLSQNKSKYLVVNLTEMYYPFYEFKSKNKISRICVSSGIEQNNIVQRFYDYKVINPLDLDIESVYLDIDRYCNILKSLYDENHIIFVENFPSGDFIDSKSGFKILKNFEKIKNNLKLIDYLNKVYCRFLSNIPSCHVVSLPDNVLASASHIWGLNPQHYIEEAYTYIGKQIDWIIQNLELPEQITTIEIYNKQKLLYNDAKMLFKHIEANYVESVNPYAELCNGYATLRIDIKSSNENKDTLSITDCVPTPLKLIKPEWLQKWRNDGDGYTVESYSGQINFKVKSTEDCELTIMLRGVDVKDKNDKRYNIFIDVQKLSINNSVIFEETHRVCHDKPYVIKKNMLSNTELLISVNWCPSYQ